MRRQLLAGRSPTVREVQEAFQMRAVQSAKFHLNALVREGKLVQEPGKARSYRLSAAPSPPCLVPLVGDVPAGTLSLAVENISGYIPVHSRHEDGAVFALRVRGDSMTDAGILDGDVVVARADAEIRSGDIVVALIDGEATVKELHVCDDEVRLLPKNPQYSAIAVRGEDLEVAGKVIEVRRFLEGIDLIDDARNG